MRKTFLYVLDKQTEMDSSCQIKQYHQLEVVFSINLLLILINNRYSILHINIIPINQKTEER